MHSHESYRSDFLCVLTTGLLSWLYWIRVVAVAGQENVEAWYKYGFRMAILGAGT